jgi:hypothetical protein
MLDPARAEHYPSCGIVFRRSCRVPNELAGQIEEVLRPVIGTVLATVSVDVEVRRIGKTVDSVEPTDVPVIADNLVEALRLVVGADLAEAAAERVREIA